MGGNLNPCALKLNFTAPNYTRMASLWTSLVSRLTGVEGEETPTPPSAINDEDLRLSRDSEPGDMILEDELAEEKNELQWLSTVGERPDEWKDLSFLEPEPESDSQASININESIVEHEKNDVLEPEYNIYKKQIEQMRNLLSKKDNEMVNLKNELKFLYQVLGDQENAIRHNNISQALSISMDQECAQCRRNFTYNDDFACLYHPGALLTLPIDDESTSPLLRKQWECCKRFGQSANGCARGRHVPIPDNFDDGPTILVSSSFTEDDGFTEIL